MRRIAGDKMVYLLVCLIITAYILNILSKKYSLSRLSYKREINKSQVEIGEEFNIRVTVENRKALPVSFLQIKEKLSKDFNYKTEMNIMNDKDQMYLLSSMGLMPYQRVKRTYTLSCSKRGRHIFYDVVLVAGDILGLKSFKMEIPNMQSITVFPKPLDIERELVPYGEYMGSISVKRWIISDPIISIGIREYTGFEPQKHIHWPSSLRANKLMVKQFDYTSDNKVMILLNIECFKPFWMNIQSEKIERCISYTRAVMEECQMSGIPYGLITNGHVDSDNSYATYSSGWGNTHLDTLLEVLGNIDYGISMTFEETLSKLIGNSIDYSTYIIITPTVFKDYIDNINTLNKRCQRLIVIALDDEKMDELSDGIISFVERGN